MNNGGAAANFDDEMNAIVLNSFKSTNKFLLIGFFAFLFYFFTVYTFATGFMPAVERSTNGKLK